MTVFVIPGASDAMTGGTLYDRRIMKELGVLGLRVDLVRLSSRFPFPHPPDLEEADAALAGLADGTVTVIDGLALGAMPDVAERHRSRLALVGLIHHPLADETGLVESDRQRLETSEARALAACRRIVVTSRATARRLGDFGVPIEKISIVPPGTDAAAVAPAGTTGQFRLLCVGTITPRKAHGVLIEALTGLRDRPWRLKCVGDTARDPETTRSLIARIAAGGLADRISLSGVVSPQNLDAYYQATDLLVSPSLYEGYGMALTEAVARGIPVVAASGGAVPETLPAGSGILVPPGDAAALCHALASVMDDSGYFQTLREGALAARARLPDWRDATLAFRAVLESVEDSQ